MHEIRQKNRGISSLNPRTRDTRKLYVNFFHLQFWDELSKIWLTDNALEEHNRRNRAVSRCSEGPAASQPPLGIIPDDHTDSYSQNELLEIKKLSRYGGPNLSDLRNFLDPRIANADIERHNSDISSVTRATSSIYNGNFEQNLIEYGIYPDEYMFPEGQITAVPDNLDEINKRLAKRRPSLSLLRCPDSEFRQFKYLDTSSRISRPALNYLLQTIEGKTPDYYYMDFGLPFNGLAPLTDGFQVTAKPDRYTSAYLESLRPQLREEFSDFIIPSRESRLIAPNFFLQARGPDRSLATVLRQACYHSALGARGIHKLRSYICDNQEDSIYNNKAYTLTLIYHGGHLRLFTTHPIARGEKLSDPKYIITQLNSWSLVSNAESFREGVATYRNARDWAKEQRNTIISNTDKRFLNSYSGRCSA
ncbi:hypothetical protein TEQG_03219 [Trichophyton equinum CBS 127.97]|uniref:Uncharacterized protein n=1 Tax=Trichophyton equinum (strain ATCC MYA-4606 / CBS 127.97) TaxID=559882 RepID=F2PQM0_TRIEC|nr:hypothetical protein TEQG_03219 [Trichophyton equinum CBS 127.97]